MWKELLNIILLIECFLCSIRKFEVIFKCADNKKFDYEQWDSFEISWRVVKNARGIFTRKWYRNVFKKWNKSIDGWQIENIENEQENVDIKWNNNQYEHEQVSFV